jgi:hypothetical protein
MTLHPEWIPTGTRRDSRGVLIGQRARIRRVNAPALPLAIGNGDE